MCLPCKRSGTQPWTTSVSRMVLPNLVSSEIEPHIPFWKEALIMLGEEETVALGSLGAHSTRFPCSTPSRSCGSPMFLASLACGDNYTSGGRQSVTSPPLHPAHSSRIRPVLADDISSHVPPQARQSRHVGQLMRFVAGVPACRDPTLRSLVRLPLEQFTQTPDRLRDVWCVLVKLGHGRQLRWQPVGASKGSGGSCAGGV